MTPIDYLIFYYLFWVGVAIYLDKGKLSWSIFGIGFVFAIGGAIVLAFLSIPLEILGIIDLGGSSGSGGRIEWLYGI